MKVIMSYTITFSDGKFRHTRSVDSYDYFTSVCNGTGINLKEYNLSKGMFFKVIIIPAKKGELFFGYFSTDPSTFFYGMSGFWKPGVVLLVDPCEWLVRAVEELGVNKVNPDRKLEAHAGRLFRFVRRVCNSHVC